MKPLRIALIVAALSACSSPKPNPGPGPSPDPGSGSGSGSASDPIPPPPPPNCGGKALGTVETIACPAGQLGDHKRVCTEKDWVDVYNSCAKPNPPPPPPPTCDGKALGTIEDLGCLPGYSGDHKRACTSHGWADVISTCTAPPPPPVLKVALPKIYKIHKGDALMLGVKDQAGVSFKWSTGDAGSMIWTTPTSDEEVTVTATRASDGATASASAYVVLQ